MNIDRLVTDRRTAFTGKKVKKYLRGVGVYHTLNSTRHPQNNGIVERVHRRILLISETEDEQCNMELMKFQRDLNISVTEKAAFESLYRFVLNRSNAKLLKIIGKDPAWILPATVLREIKETATKL